MSPKGEDFLMLTHVLFTQFWVGFPGRDKKYAAVNQHNSS